MKFELVSYRLGFCPVSHARDSVSEDDVLFREVLYFVLTVWICFFFFFFFSSSQPG